MSTRATYQFKDDHANVTFYIHCDGYPTGAATYFKAMRKQESKMDTDNHGLAECFFRANPTAEFTQNHAWHADTAYQYTVTMPENYRFGNCEHILKVVNVYSKKVLFEGTIDDFINQAKNIEKNEN